MESGGEDVQEINGQLGSYLDGTPAFSPPSETGIFGQTVAEVTNMLNPFNWFRPKPVRRTVPAPRNARRPQPPNPVRVPRPAEVSFPERAYKRRKPSEIPFGVLNLDQCMEDPPRNGMPPNVELMEDERPDPQNMKSSYLTEDEDSDGEALAGNANDMEKRRKFISVHHKRAGPADSGGLAERDTPFSRPPLKERTDFPSASDFGSSSRPSGMLGVELQKPAFLLPPLNKLPRFLNEGQPPHPSTIHTASTSSTPVVSKKRSFGDMEKQADEPQLFSNSKFPRSTDRKPAAVLALSRFGTNSSGTPSPTLFSGLKSTTGARYLDGNRIKPFGITESPQNSRSSPKPLLKPLPFNLQRPSTFLGQKNLKTVARTGLKLGDLDYKFVVRSPGASSAEDGESFVFRSMIFVPSGALAKALEESVVMLDSSPIKAPLSVGAKCRRCGITMKAGQISCQVCAKAQPASDEELTMRTEQPESGGTKREQGSRRTEQNLSAANNEEWICDICSAENRGSSEACRDCGKDKPEKKREETARSAKPAMDESAEKADSVKPYDARSEISAKRNRNLTETEEATIADDRSKSAKENDFTTKVTEKGEVKVSGQTPVEKPLTGTSSAVLDTVPQSKPAAPAKELSNVPTTSAGADSTSGTPSSFNNIWASKPKGWSCAECFVSNVEDCDQCVACGNTKPGAAPKPAASTLASFAFGTPRFGAPTQIEANKITSAPSGGFTFGAGLDLKSATSIPTVNTSIFGAAPPSSALGQGPTATAGTSSAFPSSFGGALQNVLNGPSSGGTEAGKKSESTPAASGAGSVFGALKPPSTGSFGGFGFECNATAANKVATSESANMVTAPSTSSATNIFGGFASGALTSPATSTGSAFAGFAGFNGAQKLEPVPAVPTSFSFGLPSSGGTFAGFMSQAPSAAGFGAGTNLPSSTAAVPATSTSGGLGGFTFGMPKIDTSTFSGMHKVDTSTFSGFGQPIQNGQPAQSAVNGGFQSLSSMTGAQSTPSEQTLSILGQAAAVGAPSVGFGAGGIPRRGPVRAKRNLPR